MKSNKDKSNRLQDNVVLIINGLCQSGGVLANMLSQQGADVAIIDFEDTPALSLRIQHDVAENGRRCLVLTPKPMDSSLEAFAQQAMSRIRNKLGRLDAFITYSATDKTRTIDAGKQQNGKNGRSPQLAIFDQYDLTKAALKEIVESS